MVEAATLYGISDNILIVDLQHLGHLIYHGGSMTYKPILMPHAESDSRRGEIKN